MPEPGAIMRLRTMRHYVDPNMDSPIRSEDWTAKKGLVYVCLVIGWEKQDGSDPLDIPSAMAALGFPDAHFTDEADGSGRAAAAEEGGQ